MLKSFRLVAYLEGISFLTLLGIAMPMKYLYGMPMAVRMVGSVHGLLFIIYVTLLANLSTELKWPRKKTLWGFVAAVVPFGTFAFDRSLREPSA